MYDSVSAYRIPPDALIVAGYVDGDYAWTEEEWALFPDIPHVRLAVFSDTDDGNCADVESRDQTPTSVVGWVQRRRAAGVDPSVYCGFSNWAEVRQAFNDAGEPEPHYWVAGWNGQQSIPDGAVAHQYTDGGDYDSSVVADFWPGVDPIIDATDGGKQEEDMTREDVIAIVDEYLAKETKQGDSAQNLILDLLRRMQDASNALNLNLTPETK